MKSCLRSAPGITEIWKPFSSPLVVAMLPSHSWKLTLHPRGLNPESLVEVLSSQVHKREPLPIDEGPVWEVCLPGAALPAAILWKCLYFLLLTTRSVSTSMGILLAKESHAGTEEQAFVNGVGEWQFGTPRVFSPFSPSSNKTPYWESMFMQSSRIVSKVESSKLEPLRPKSARHATV